MDNRPIGIFDSGLGGLTVMKEIVNQLPDENIVYFGDTGRVPYGTKSNETIRKYAREDANFLLKKNVKAIIAACGTVSAVAPDIANLLPVPFFEMISPAAEAAVKATRNNKIGIIGTPATVKSNAHKNKILSLLPSAEIYAAECPLFVPLVEEGFTSGYLPEKVAEKYLLPLKAQNIDTLILGCTHYPLLYNIIADIMGSGVTLINPAEDLSVNIKNSLKAKNMLNNCKGVHNYFLSDITVTFESTAKNLLGKVINSDFVKQVNIDTL